MQNKEEQSSKSNYLLIKYEYFQSPHVKIYNVKFKIKSILKLYTLLKISTRPQTNKNVKNNFVINSLQFKIKKRDHENKTIY